MDETLFNILGQYQISKESIVSCTRLPSGINYVYLIITNRGKFILKEYKKLKPPHLFAVHKCLIKLIKQGVPLPKILPNKNNEFLTSSNKRYFDLAEFIEHIDLSDQITINDQDLKLAGKTLAFLQKNLDDKEVYTICKKIDFAELAFTTQEAITKFLKDFESIIQSASTEKEKHRLIVLKEVILATEKFRKDTNHSFTEFFLQPYVPTQGDFSMVNVLIKPDRKSVYVIDWDQLALRPLVWDLQAALSLFSLSKLGNAYFMQPNFHKMKLFLEGYLPQAKITNEQLKLLPIVAKYNFAFYWLSYTLPAMINHDFRLLLLIPDSKEAALYWLKGFEQYKEFLKDFSV